MLPVVDTDRLDQCLVRLDKTRWGESEPRPWANDAIAAHFFVFRPVSKAEPGAQLAAGRGMEQTRVASTAIPITLQVVAALAGHHI